LSRIYFHSSLPRAAAAGCSLPDNDVPNP